MSLAVVLNFTIPAVVLAYAAYLIIRALRARVRGSCGGGCAGCPYMTCCRDADKGGAKKERDRR